VTPNDMEELVDKRPQGRNFLYAQCAQKGATLFRDGTLASPPPTYTLPTKPTASMPGLSFQTREFVGRKAPTEEIPSSVKLDNKHIPGYTGHLHGEQHVFGTSFGETSHRLQNSALDTTGTSMNLLGFGEGRPQAPLLQGGGARIPGYTGHIPAKDRHIYGHTYGSSALLAKTAVAEQREGGSAAALPQLVDHRPQGRVDLYTQEPDADLARTAELRDRSAVLPPHLKMTVDKFVAAKAKTTKAAQLEQFRQSAHCLPGYTGHIHGDQHVYGTTYGKTTGQLLEHGTAKQITSDLIKFEDARPQRTGGTMALRF